MQSKQGATSANTQKAKGGCLQHNRRTQAAANVDPNRSHLNTAWEHDRIKNLASTRSLIKHAEKLYTAKTGQKCQLSFAPLKETCVVCKDSTTIEEAMKIARKVEEQTGIVCLGIWIHRDEGHARSRFCPDEPYQCNNHLHILWDCQDHETGKAIPIKRQHLRDMQDIAADALGMERGNPAELTKRKHVDSMNYKAQALAKEIETIEKENQKLREETKELQKVNTGLLAKIEDAWKWKGKFKDAEKVIEAQKATIGKLRKHAETAEEGAKEAYKSALELHKAKMNERVAEAQGKAIAAENRANTAEKEAKLAKDELAKVREENGNLSYTVNKLTQKLWGQSENQLMRETIICDVLEFKEHPDYRDEWVATWGGYTVATAKVKRDGTVDITEWHPDQESTRMNHAQNINEAWARIRQYTLYDFDDALKEFLGQGGGMRR